MAWYVSILLKTFYIINTQYPVNTFSIRCCILQTCTTIPTRGSTSSSFRGGWAILMKFHLMTSLRFFNRGTTFSQTVTYKFLFATFPKMRAFQF